MSETNGNAVILRVMSIVGPVAALVIGIVIGVYATQATFQEKFTSKADHDKDIQRVENTLTEMNRKLDRLLERGH